MMRSNSGERFGPQSSYVLAVIHPRTVDFADELLVLADMVDMLQIA